MVLAAGRSLYLSTILYYIPAEHGGTCRDKPEKRIRVSQREKEQYVPRQRSKRNITDLENYELLFMAGAFIPQAGER